MLLRTPDPSAQYDVLVAGAGAAGLVLAVDLARRGRKVLVIEEGPERLDANYAARNAAIQSGPRCHVGTAEGRYKGLGGTTRLWGGQLMRFAPSDFEPDASLGKPGWPVSLAELLPFYDSALAMLGLGEDHAAIAGKLAQRIGRPLTIDPALEIAPAAWMREPDFTRLFTAEIAAPSGPAILTGHRVANILSDETAGRVAGFVISDAGGRETRIIAPHCVLANGTIEISALLLRLQRMLPASSLAGNRHVGRHFIDHLHGIAGTVEMPDRAAIGRLFDTSRHGGLKLTPKLRLSDGELCAGGNADVAVTFNAPIGIGEAARDAAALLRRMARFEQGPLSGLRETMGQLGVLAPLAWNYLRNRRSGKFLSGTISLGLEVEQLPFEGSYIALEDGVPAPLAKPVIHWGLSGREMPSIRRVCGEVARFCQENALGSAAIDPKVLDEDADFLESLREANHHMGGARMAESGAQGVVDSTGEVFGMPGLYVAGAATFPSGGFANPTLTALALALRTGQQIAGPG